MNPNTVTSQRRAWIRCRLKLSQLRCSSAWQRPIDLRKVRTIVKDFDWKLVQTIVVGRYPDGTLAVADGQHTGRAIFEKLGANEWVECDVTEVVDDHDFANLVEECNPIIGDKPTAINYFWIHTCRNIGNAPVIHKCAREAGFEIVREGSKRNHVDCVGQILRIYNEAGEMGLYQVFAVARKFFPGETVHDYMLLGIRLLIKHCTADPAFDIGRMARVISAEPIFALEHQSKILAKAEKCTRAKAFAKVLLSTYDQRKEQHFRKCPVIKAQIP